MLETQFDGTDDEDKGQSATDTDDKFTECQTPRKKLELNAISPLSLHALITNAKMKLIKSNILEPYKVQVDCWKDSESVLMIKMI